MHTPFKRSLLTPHLPFPEQSLWQTGISQNLPFHRGSLVTVLMSHRHFSFASSHSPCLLQYCIFSHIWVLALRFDLDSHDIPYHPSVHTHVPFIHLPFPLQVGSQHACSLHPSPIQPCSQWQRLVSGLHRPWPLQSPGQDGFSQLPCIHPSLQ